MAGSPTLRLDLLGGFHLTVDGRAAIRLPSARQQQLISYLVLHARDAPVPRQRVAAALWPESTDAQALTNLRRELHHLRDGFPRLDALIAAGSRTLAWDGGARATIDLMAFERAADRGTSGDAAALREAAALYKGDLLPDASGEWIDTDRDRLRQRAQQVLTRLVSHLETERAFGEAIDHLQQLLRLDPLDEPAWCALMRCHARRGERATALHIYQQCAALLKKELGVQPSATTRMTYREILDLDAAAASVTPATPRAAVYPLVGRHSEWQTLLNAWRGAADGKPRLFVIRGEAGIGKTRLAEELVDWCAVQNVSTATARCYAGEGRLAYAPLVTWLKSSALQAALMRLDAYWMTDVTRLRPELLAARPEVPAPDSQLESWQRVRFFDAVSQAFRSAAPLVLVIDDVQWADGDTIEWLQYFLHSAGDARCLVVGTVRAEEEQDNPPLVRMLGRLERDNLVTTIALGPLDQAATAQLAGEVAEEPLDEAAIARTYRETEGHPLFIVERGRMGMTRLPAATGEQAPQVQSVLAARLALLSDEARAAAEVASAVGRDFRFDILAQASDLEEDALVRAVDELWRRQIVRVQDEERWDFSHDRLREVAYAGIGPARRRLIHRRIAQGMELLFAGRLDDVSASIAAHLDQGGQAARAIPFLERAAAVATRVSANEEAIRCLNYGLSLLATLPAGRDRDRRELDLRSKLSIALNSTRGYAAPEIEHNLDRVFELSRDEGREPVPVRWLWVAFTFRFMLGDLKRTRHVAEEAIARVALDPSCACEAHHAMGGLLQVAGEFEPACGHFEASLAAYDEANPQRSALGSDLGVFCHAWYSHALWFIGDDAGAVAHVDQAIALARRLDHMYSQTLALAYAAMLHQLRRDARRVLDAAEAVLAMCERYGFAYYGEWAQVLMGWARGQQHPADEIATIESAIERLDAIRARARRSYFLSLLAETCALAGQSTRASSILDEAIALADESGERYWLPALYLQKAEIDPTGARADTLRLALDTARAQGNRGIEQRILGTLSRTV